MGSYYFPCIGIDPDQLPQAVDAELAAVHRRRWRATTFDFAALGARHELHFSWHFLEVFFAAVSCELEIKACDELSRAQDRLHRLQVLLYAQGLAPFVVPFCMTRPMADYAGINTRDSGRGLDKLPDELRTGFRSEEGKIEGWLHEPTLNFFSIPERDKLTVEMFHAAVDNLSKLEDLEAEYPPLSTARRALQTAPVIPDLGSSLLHAWQGIEALFPKVSTEVSYRLALLIAQLVEGPDRRSTYQAARASYGKRSQAAHGSFQKIGHADWVAAWDLLAQSLAGCLNRRALPTEDHLITELLDRATAPNVAAPDG